MIFLLDSWSIHDASSDWLLGTFVDKRGHRNAQRRQYLRSSLIKYVMIKCSIPRNTKHQRTARMIGLDLRDSTTNQVAYLTSSFPNTMLMMTSGDNRTKSSLSDNMCRETGQWFIFWLGCIMLPDTPRHIRKRWIAIDSPLHRTFTFGHMSNIRSQRMVATRKRKHRNRARPYKRIIHRHRRRRTQCHCYRKQHSTNFGREHAHGHTTKWLGKIDRLIQRNRLSMRDNTYHRSPLDKLDTVEHHLTIGMHELDILKSTNSRMRTFDTDPKIFWGSSHQRTITSLSHRPRQCIIKRKKILTVLDDWSIMVRIGESITGVNGTMRRMDYSSLKQKRLRMRTNNKKVGH